MKKFSIALLVLISFGLLGASPFVRTNGEPNVQGPLHLFDGLIDTTKGIVSEPVMATTEDITLYVRTTGDDTNDGLTVGTALRQPQEAVDRAPKVIKHNVTIDIGEGSFGAFDISGFTITITGKLIVGGVLGAPTLTTGTTTGTATGGTTLQLVDTGQNWTVNELRGMLVLVNGNYRIAMDNDATTINFGSAYSATCSGKAYSILTQKTIVTGTSALGYGPVAITGNTLSHRSKMELNDLKTTSGTIGVALFNTDYGAINRIWTTGAYYGFFIQEVLVYGEIKELYSSNNANTGILLGARGAWYTARVGCYLNTSYGISATNADLFGTTGFTNNNGVGVYIWSMITEIDFDTNLYVRDNTGDGIQLQGVPFADFDSNTIIENNGGYGIYIDENASGNRNLNSFVNIVGTVVIQDNALGGIIAKNHSIVALTACTGTNTAGYGLELQTGSYATITSATAITGATGDATINGGVTDLSWATDFNDDGDIVNNLSNFCTIERKD